jgi:hypothetical protein
MSKNDIKALQAKVDSHTEETDEFLADNAALNQAVANTPWHQR